MRMAEAVLDALCNFYFTTVWCVVVRWHTATRNRDIEGYLCASLLPSAARESGLVMVRSSSMQFDAGMGMGGGRGGQELCLTTLGNGPPLLTVRWLPPDLHVASVSPLAPPPHAVVGCACVPFSATIHHVLCVLQRALNLELASVRDACRNNPATARFRFLFWRELVNGAFKVQALPSPPHSSLSSLPSSPPPPFLSTTCVSVGVGATTANVLALPLLLYDGRARQCEPTPTRWRILWLQLLPATSTPSAL